MFDISFLEIIVVAIVALVVVGPERLPRVARTAGFWVARARRTLSELKAEVDRELRIEELKQSIQDGGALEEMKALKEDVGRIQAPLTEADLGAQAGTPKPPTSTAPTKGD